MLRFLTFFLLLSTAVFSQGWHDNPNTHLFTNATGPKGLNPTDFNGCPPNGYGAGTVQGGVTMSNFNWNDVCHGIIDASSGGALDTKRNRLYVMGGGHSISPDNSVYYYDFNSNPISIHRATNPSVVDTSTGLCPDPMPSDGTKYSTHSYGGLVYMPNVDRLFMQGGASFCNSADTLTWLYNPATDTWTNALPTPSLGSFGGPSTDGQRCFWNPTRDRVDCEYGNNLMWMEYDPVGNAWTKLTNFSTFCLGLSSTTCNSNQSVTWAYDPVRKLAIGIGGNNNTVPATSPMALEVLVTDFSTGTNYATQDWSGLVTGCGGITTQTNGANLTGQFPGVAYDPAREGMVIYPGAGNSVLLFNPTTRQCTTHTFPNGPPVTARMSITGTFGRFVLSTASKSFFVVTGIDGDVFGFKLDHDPVYGNGSSSTTCHDQDGDGYGTGPLCVGLDADDLDATTHSTADVLTKWGSVSGWMNHLGYAAAHIWYVNGTVPQGALPAGNDLTCVVCAIGGSCDLNPPANAKPCATYGKINALVRPGDAIIAGLGWNNLGSSTNVSPPPYPTATVATSGNPYFIMSYPGELAALNTSIAGSASKINVIDCPFIVVDGFGLQSGGVISGGTTDESSTFAETTNYGGVSIQSRVGHRIIKHIHGSGGGDGLGLISAFNGLLDWQITDNVLHDAGVPNQHNIYIGARNFPDAMVHVARNTLYNAQLNNLHLNGRMYNTEVDDNLNYNATVANMSAQNGIAHSYFRSNITFGYHNASWDFDTYPGSQPGSNCGNALNQTCTCPNSTVDPGPQIAHDVCPNSQFDNLIENNTIVSNGADPCTGSPGGSTCTSNTVNNNQYSFTVFNTSFVTNANLNHGQNFFRNNIMVVTGAANTFVPLHISDVNTTTCDAGCLAWASSDTFQNGDFWQSDSTHGSNIMRLGASLYTCSTMTAHVLANTSCLNVDPQFKAAPLPGVNTPFAYDFHIPSSSPVALVGLLSNSNIMDFTGLPYAIPSPSLGAYEATVITPPVLLPSGITGAILSGQGIIK